MVTPDCWTNTARGRPKKTRVFGTLSCRPGNAQLVSVVLKKKTVERGLGLVSSVARRPADGSHVYWVAHSNALFHNNQWTTDFLSDAVDLCFNSHE